MGCETFNVVICLFIYGMRDVQCSHMPVWCTPVATNPSCMISMPLSRMNGNLLRDPVLQTLERIQLNNCNIHAWRPYVRLGIIYPEIDELKWLKLPLKYQRKSWHLSELVAQPYSKRLVWGGVKSLSSLSDTVTRICFSVASCDSIQRWDTQLAFTVSHHVMAFRDATAMAFSDVSRTQRWHSAHAFFVVCILRLFDLRNLSCRLTRSLFK